MITRYVFPAEFPQRSVEIADIDHVACSVADLYTITDAERLANEDVNPGDEAFHRRLDGEADDDRSNTERSKRAIPIHKNHRDNNGCDCDRDDQMLNTLQGEPNGGVFD